VDGTGWTLSVTDDGVGRPPPSPDQRVGLGTGVVNSLARQLRARVEFGDAAPGARVAVVRPPEPATPGAAEPVG